MARGTLYVVATPIGHLEDITLRALRTLKSVALVAAEDTRRTSKLLRHYAIATPILSVHQHNERARIARILAHLDKGKSVALVSDAGTPAVSDPGAALVAAVRDAGFRVEPIPGPSAVLAALSVAGVPASEFVFMGFPPVRSKDRNKWLADLATFAVHRPVVAFEAPHRIRRTLQELTDLVRQPIIVARELTKLHEEILVGTPHEIMERLRHTRGEFVLVIQPNKTTEAAIEDVEQASDSTRIAAEIGQMTESQASTSKRQVARAIASRLGLTTRQVYEAMERQKFGRTANR